MRCSRCGEEVGNLFCGKCRAEIEQRQVPDKEDLFPVLYYNPKNKTYHFGCKVVMCPCNKNLICISSFVKLPKFQLHEFDGDNIVHGGCG